jgi:hypothetical protein
VRRTGEDAGLGEWEGAVWELCGWGEWEAGLLRLGGRIRIMGERGVWKGCRGWTLRIVGWSL